MLAMFFTIGQAWVGVFGLVAAATSFRNGWKATALPPETNKDDAAEVVSPPDVSGYDATS